MLFMEAYLLSPNRNLNVTEVRDSDFKNAFFQFHRRESRLGILFSGAKEQK